MSTIAERVAAGAAWLDVNRPGWDREIDLNRLVLSSPCRCVLGQLYGSYEDAPLFDGGQFGFGAPMGFNAAGALFTDFRESDWNGLEAEWRRVITDRRASG